MYEWIDHDGRLRLTSDRPNPCETPLPVRIVQNQQSPFADLDAPEHIRNLHVTWLDVVRYFHRQCENLGIHTIGEMMDATEDDLRLLFIIDSDHQTLSVAIRALIEQFPDPS